MFTIRYDWYGVWRLHSFPTLEEAERMLKKYHSDGVNAYLMEFV